MARTPVSGSAGPGIRVGVRRGEYASGPPPSSVMTTTVTTVNETVVARLAGTRTPALSGVPLISGTSGKFCKRGGREQHERRGGKERKREYMREHGMASMIGTNVDEKSAFDVFIDGAMSWSVIVCRMREEGMGGVWWRIGGTIKSMFRLR